MSQVLNCNAFGNNFGDELIKTQKNGDLGRWNFLKSLGSNNGTDPDRVGKERKDEIYVHPLAKRSSSRLNKKSLEMCTESLGSETGSDNGEDISLLVTEVTETSVVSASLKRREDGFWEKKRNSNRGEGFPPPINSIYGENGCGGGLKVESCRQNGKLILRAVWVSSPVSRFRSERTDGRLRLCFFNDSYLNKEKGIEEEEEGVKEELICGGEKSSKKNGEDVQRE